MPKLIFINGQEQEVTYHKAAQINDILTGIKAPSPEQEKFCLTIKQVVFEERSETIRYIERRTIEHDTEMDKILSSGLHGHDLFVAVGNRIRQRLTS